MICIPAAESHSAPAENDLLRYLHRRYSVWEKMADTDQLSFSTLRWCLTRWFLISADSIRSAASACCEEDPRSASWGGPTCPDVTPHLETGRLLLSLFVIFRITLFSNFIELYVNIYQLQIQTVHPILLTSGPCSILPLWGCCSRLWSEGCGCRGGNLKREAFWSWVAQLWRGSFSWPQGSCVIRLGKGQRGLARADHDRGFRRALERKALWGTREPNQHVLCGGGIVKTRSSRFGHLNRILPGAFLWRFSGHVQLVGDPGVDPEHTRARLYISSGLGTAQEHGCGEGCWPPRPGPWISDSKLIDGCT